MRDDVAAELLVGVPRIPASASALIFDADGRLLILKPSYKKGWTLPGGQIESTGESPWEACRREALEECGVEVTRGRLACVDFLAPKRDRPGGVRFLFDCGAVSEHQQQSITLQAEEIDAYRFAELTEAAALLSGPIRRRVSASAGTARCVYLEEGRPVPGIADQGR